MRLTKIIILFKRFFSSKKNWSFPKKNKLMLYDAFENNFLIDFLRPWKPTLFHLRGEETYVLVLIISLFKFKSLKEAYIDTFIKFVNPVLIVSFNDNSPYFFSISKRFENIKTLFIQNGWRAYYGDIFEYLDNANKHYLSTLNVDYKMFFGEVNSIYFSNYIDEGESKNIGSIRNNYFSQRFSKEKDLIIFVSQWNGSAFQTLKNNYSEDVFFKSTDYFILDFLNDYCRKKSMRFKILLRNSFNKKNIEIEKKYYQSLIDEKLDFIISDTSCNAYDATDKAEIVVGIESTLLYESLARGNKTAIFSVRDHILSMEGYDEFMKVQGFTFGWPGKYSDKGFFWTNKASKNDLQEIMNNLININQEDWKEVLKNFSFDSLMKYDPGNTMIQKVLRDELDPLN